MSKITIAQDFTNEIVIKKSRFITSLKRVQSVNEAQAFLTDIKKKTSKASHHCSAYIIDSLQQHASDDGEPQGTAGIPMLETLQAMQVQNTLAVVTRFFGGIKLGSGGLIRAYRQSVSEAINQAGRVQSVLQQQLLITLDYKQLDMINYWLKQQPVNLVNTTYAAQVQLTLLLDQQHTSSFLTDLNNQLHAQIPVQMGPTTFHEIPYLQ